MIELKDVFINEDPVELNIKLNSVQVEKQKVIQALISVGTVLGPSRTAIHSHLRRNYRRALAESKKSAGIDALELWAGADMQVLDGERHPYDAYIEAKERFEYLDKVRASYEKDMSALQSRINIFKETS